MNPNLISNHATGADGLKIAVLRKGRTGSTLI
jgi:hypothetical protein